MLCKVIKNTPYTNGLFQSKNAFFSFQCLPFLTDSSLGGQASPLGNTDKP